MAKTKIIESLVAKRNQRVVSLQTPPPPEDLELDDPQPVSKKIKLDKSAFPDYIEIESPAVGDIGGMTMKVLPGVGNESLWLELLPEVIDYLVKVAKHEVATSTRTTRQNRQHALAGVSFEARRESYRGRRAGGETKYFSSKKYADAAAAAAAWVAGKGSDDEDIGESQGSGMPSQDV